MAKDKEKILSDIVNASGFLFQLTVENKVMETKQDHKWTVLFHEYPWTDVESGKEGYIDLILSNQHDSMRFVIECKRSLNADWIFLLPESSRKKLSRADIIFSDCAEKNFVALYEFIDIPKSYESEFCVIRGQGEDDISMLERISSKLIKSTEYLAEEENNFIKEQKGRDKYFYIPAIVTSAHLNVCRFNPSDVSLDDGKLPKGQFESVPFIRFRKTLAKNPLPKVFPYSPYSYQVPMRLHEFIETKKRTVLIIQASELIPFLVKLGSIL